MQDVQNKYETYEITYKFDAPNISPEFYFIGPAKAFSDEFWFDSGFEDFSAGSFSIVKSSNQAGQTSVWYA